MKVTIRKRRGRQQRIEFSTHGGRRRGAGRKRRGGRRRVPHRRRPALRRPTPVHVTLRVAADVPYLRNFERCRVLRRAFCRSAGAEFRICQFSVQGNHVHLICEANSNPALSRGVQSFEQRVTRWLNALCDRRGTVWADRYHLEVLRSPRQVRNALSYVINNWRRHGIAPAGDQRLVDPFSSARYFDGWAAPPPASGATHDATAPPALGAKDEATAVPVSPAQTWLLAVGWRRHGLIEPEETPAAGRR